MSVSSREYLARADVEVADKKVAGHEAVEEEVRWRVTLLRPTRTWDDISGSGEPLALAESGFCSDPASLRFLSRFPLDVGE